MGLIWQQRPDQVLKSDNLKSSVTVIVEEIRYATEKTRKQRSTVWVPQGQHNWQPALTCWMPVIAGCERASTQTSAWNLSPSPFSNWLSLWGCNQRGTACYISIQVVSRIHCFKIVIMLKWKVPAVLGHPCSALKVWRNPGQLHIKAYILFSLAREEE